MSKQPNDQARRPEYRRGNLARLVALIAATVAFGCGLLAYRANEDRWREGPTIVVISPTHGVHEMDVLLLGAALSSAMIALIALLIAKR